MLRTRMIWAPFLFVPLSAWSRDLAVVTLVLGAVLVLFSREGDWRRIVASHLRTPAGALAGAFVVWTLAAVFWSPRLPLTDWLKVALALLSVYVLATGLAHISKPAVQKLIGPLLFSVFALLGLLGFERLTGGLLIRLGRTSDTAPQILDALSGGLVFLCCASFPAAWLIWRRSGRVYWAAIFIAACFALSLSYRMDAIPAAMIVGMLAGLMSMKWRGPGFAIAFAALGLVALSWGPVSMAAAASNLDAWFMENVDRNWGYRIVIWSYVGALIPEHFFVGHGFDAARVVGGRADLFPDRAGQSPFLHPHNGVLQLWLELGTIGVVLFMTTMALFLRSALKCAPERSVLSAAAGTLGFSATIWLLSYGIWQGWWIAVLGLAACAVLLVYRVNTVAARDV